jgi:YidC/Oxa1 family membrane protein insertase
MDRNTIIAVVLAVVVIIGGMLLQNLLAPKKPATALPTEKPPAAAEQPAPELTPAPQPAAGQAANQPPSQGVGAAPSVTEGELSEESFTMENDVMRVRFTNRGGDITSIQLKDYKNRDGSPVEMVISKDTRLRPLSLHFGDHNSEPVNALFRVERAVSAISATFTRTFAARSGVPFTLRKSYLLQPKDYLIELRVSIENSVNEYPDLNFDGTAYSLSLGPQIGPAFEKLDRQNEYRTYMYYADGKKRDVRIGKEGVQVLKNRVTWAAIAGKYFEVIAVPDATQYTLTYDTRPLSGLKDRSSLYFSRPEIKSSKNIDVFRFYVGPKKREILARYNNSDKNGFKLVDLHFEESIPSSPLIGWLANILKFFLELFYRAVPNYGVAILLLTLLIKLLFWPLTNKSYESTAKMQALQPKIKELQAKYKANPQKMNQEMAALYKKEGVSPLGGCLPLLLQMPIFFALYNLLSTHFELRGASFITGWIGDLSAPDSLFHFTPFTVPLINLQISSLRVLPFLMLGTTFLQSKVSQSATPTDRNMALMTYAMPIVFFFILYNMPSGLVLYWTAQNILGIVQQLYTNYRRGKKAPAEAQASETWKYPKRRKP